MTRPSITGIPAAVSAVVACLALLAGCSSAQHESAPKRSAATQKLLAQADLQPCPSAGKPASGGKLLPDLSIGCLGGDRSVSLRSLTGTPTVLNFWASWCDNCVAEMSTLQRFATAAAGKVRVLGVNSQDLSEQAPLNVLTAAKVHFPSVFDKEGKVSHAMGLPGLPVTVLVRADGSVAQQHLGPVSFDQLRALTQQHLHVAIRG